MLCPYCNAEYNHEHPCFCHPSLHVNTTEENPLTFPETFPSIAWNSHRGARLD